MKNLFILSFLSISSMISAFTPSEENIPEYKIPLHEGTEITLDGQRNEAVWNQAHKITQFINPWNKQVNPKTSVELFYDGKDLYFFFEAFDQEVVISDPYKNKMDVVNEDRVEFFFSKDMDLSSYYGFEIDPEGRILDYQCTYYRKFNYNWTAGDGIRVKTMKTSNGYIVEGCITKELLDFMTDNQISFYWGAYRAEYSRGNNGKLIDKWQCIRDPKTKAPDFHLPSSFCKMILGSN